MDGLKSSHPIQVPVWDPAEISQIFDAISYSKGASVIRMLNDFLGESTFKSGTCCTILFIGVGHYLQKYKYRNAKTEDLWTELSAVSKVDGMC